MISPPHINGPGQHIELGENSPWCTVTDGMIKCNGSQSFTSSREMWWYLAISRCINATYPVSKHLLLCHLSAYFLQIWDKVQEVLILLHNPVMLVRLGKVILHLMYAFVNSGPLMTSLVLRGLRFCPVLFL